MIKTYNNLDFYDDRKLPKGKITATIKIGIDRRIIANYEKARKKFNEIHDGHVLLNTFLDLGHVPETYNLYFHNLDNEKCQEIHIPLLNLQKYKINELVELYDEVYKEICEINNWKV